jgi:uncharacterized protein (TIGR03790 family)
VLCYGVPLKISPDPNLKEPSAETLRAELRRNEAAVDSELAVLPLIEQDLPLAGPLRNPGYGSTNGSWFHPTNGVLMVSRLDAPTAAIARSLIDKALEAEKNGMWGRAYLDVRKTSEENFKVGDNWIYGAAELCRRLGLETVLDENPGTFPAGFPMSQIGVYIGWYDENVSGPLSLPKVEFMPGAFGYHLHSFSAATLRSTNRNWVGPLLSKGVTTTMGSVYEPYLSGTPDMAVFTSRLILDGFTFGEAAYASQAVLSWQTTVVGDPLYRPFGKHPEELHQQLMRDQRKELEWSYLRLVNINLANNKPLADWVSFLAEQLELTKTSALLTEKLGDLYGIQGKPASAARAYAQALKLDPSPQQQIRLRLNLGEKLTESDQPGEAYEAYQQLLRQAPDYPDKVTVYRRLLPLAQRLNKKADAERYEAQIR